MTERTAEKVFICKCETPPAKKNRDETTLWRVYFINLFGVVEVGEAGVIVMGNILTSSGA